MSEYKNPNGPIGDEIDLRTVFKKIGNFFSAIINYVLAVIALSFNKWLLLLPFVLAGIALGFLGHRTTKPYYNSSMVMMLSNIRNDFVKNHLYNLSELVAEDNHEVLSQSLGIKVEEAKKIKEMTFVNIDEEKVTEDSILTGSPFRIELKLYDRNLFPKLEKSITDYLENNPYFSRTKTIRQQQIESLLFKLKEDIASIDSIKTTVTNPRGPSNGFVYGEATDPTNLYKEGMSMFERRAMLEAELKNIDNIQVVVGFTTRTKPASLSLKKFLFYGALLGYLIGLIFLLVREQRNMVSNNVSESVYH